MFAAQPAVTPRRARVRFALALTIGTLCLISSTALAATMSGTTSQHGAVRADIGKHNRLTGLIIQLKTRCTDHKRRDIWPGFQAPFQHPQDASGRVSDSYNIRGRDVATGARFRQRASFSARISRRTLKGSATVTETLIAKGVTCTSPRVTFTVHL